MNDSSANLTQRIHKEYKQYLMQHSEIMSNHNEQTHISNNSIHKKGGNSSDDSANILKELEGINQQSVIYPQE